jgi:hypothetical protein
MDELPESAAAHQGGEDLSAQRGRFVRRVAWCVLMVGIMHGLLGTVSLALFVTGSKPGDGEWNASQLLAMDSVALYGLAGLFGVLAWCGLSRPLLAAMTAILVFACWLGLHGLRDPHALVQGWVLEVLVAAALGQSLLAGLRYHFLTHLPRQN